MATASLGDRMKGYEGVTRTYLTRRTPVIIRIDGKAFHTFTSGMVKPFDNVLTDSMQSTMKRLCENIQGCVLGYTQSDEITLVLVDYKSLNSDAWFDNNIQKMVSVSASMATAYFNKAFRLAFEAYVHHPDRTSPYSREYLEACWRKIDCAMFDSRVFNIPKEEVCNCLIWRQQDATRNSIESTAQAHFSHKQLHGKSCDVLQDMLMIDKGINWNDTATKLKRGSCCIKETYRADDDGINADSQPILRTRWTIDNEIPIFTQNRKYVESLIYFED